MTKIELKTRLIEKINQISNDDLLMDALKLLNEDFTDTDVYKLTDAHKASVETAINQIANGEFLTNEQANKDIDEWLNK